MFGLVSIISVELKQLKFNKVVLFSNNAITGIGFLTMNSYVFEFETWQHSITGYGKQIN